MVKSVMHLNNKLISLLRQKHSQSGILLNRQKNYVNFWFLLDLILQQSSKILNSKKWFKTLSAILNSIIKKIRMLQCLPWISKELRIVDEMLEKRQWEPSVSKLCWKILQKRNEQLSLNLVKVLHQKKTRELWRRPNRSIRKRDWE